MKGVDDAVENIYRAAGLQEFGDWLEQNTGGPIKVDKPETIAGKIAAPLAQGVVSMVPAAKAFKALGVASSFLQWTFGGALADFAAFAPEDPGIADITSKLGDLPQPQLEAVRREIEEWIKKDESDSDLVKRLKGAAEGALIGGAVDGIIQVAKAAKKTITALGTGAAVSALSSDEAEAGPAKEILKALAKLGIKQAEPFYAKSLRIVTELKTTKASGEQWLGELKNSGVKPDEITWMGLDSFLAGKKSVSKAELEEFMQANQIKIKESISGDEVPLDNVPVSQIELDASAERQFGVRFDELLPEQQARVRTELEEMPIDLDEVDIGALELETGRKFVRFENEVLPGGENYKEWLFTLPPTDDPNLISRRIFGKSFSELSNSDREAVSVALTKPEGQRAGSYTDPHFNETNLFVHTRTNDRGDTFFIEEIQSDWLQEGRKSGFGVNFTKEDLIAKPLEGDPANLVPKGWIIDVPGTILEPGGIASRNVIVPLTEARTAKKAVDVAYAKMIQFTRTPHAPFKNTWYQIAFRRMVRHAVENDFARIAWTTGEQQAKRYNLGGVSDRIAYKKINDDTYEITLFRGPREADVNGNIVINDHRVNDTGLDDFVGQDIAKRIRAGEGEINPANLGFQDVPILEAKVELIGDEGMNKFYDEIIVNYANKFGKKFGAKVSDFPLKDIKEFGISLSYERPQSGAMREFRAFEGAEDIASDPFWIVKNEKTGEVLKKSLTKEEGRALVADLLKKLRAKSPLENVHSLPITDKMREIALKEGFPLF